MFFQPVESLETRFCRWGARDGDGPRTACASVRHRGGASTTPAKAAATAAETAGGYCSTKSGLKDLRGRQEDWEDWRIEHQEKAKAMGFVDELTTHEGHDIMVGAEGFDASGVDLVRLRQARQAWTSVITTCNGTARDLVKSEESPDGAWRLLNQHYRASGLKEKRRLVEEFNFMKMEIGEPPTVHHEGRQCSKGTEEVGKDYR